MEATVVSEKRRDEILIKTNEPGEKFSHASFERILLYAFRSCSSESGVLITTNKRSKEAVEIFEW